MSAIRSNIKISPHGGVVPVLKKIKEFGIPQVIRSTLGTRKKQSKYGYEDVFIAWILTALCGGTRLEHIKKLEKKLNIIPGLKLPSPDTLGRVMKKLASEKKVHRNITRRKEATMTFSEYDENLLLNKMLVKATKRIGLLQSGKKYSLDIDATFIYTMCNDSKRSFEKEYGFYPMICAIGDLPVYISMRNGNVAPQFQIKDCLEKCIDILEQNNIKIGVVTSDSAGYSIETMQMLDSRGIKFLIRPRFHSKNALMRDSLSSCDNWRQTQISTSKTSWNCEIGDMVYVPFETNDRYRLIALKFPSKETQKLLDSEPEKERKKMIGEKMKGLKEKNILKNPKGLRNTMGKEFDGYEYKLYITNDFSKSPEEIVLEFNKRSGTEKKFDYMKNDFAWRLPPFMKLTENTVFFVVAALANNIFKGIVRLFKKDIPQLRMNARLLDFQFIFIDVACSYIDKTYIFYNTDIEYEKLM